jgi:hypothetical protein
MKKVIAFIKEHGFKNVKLGVIAANGRARNFYEAKWLGISRGAS